jgi:hypothetical protein
MDDECSAVLRETVQILNEHSRVQSEAVKKTSVTLKAMLARQEIKRDHIDRLYNLKISIAAYTHALQSRNEV